MTPLSRHVLVTLWEDGVQQRRRWRRAGTAATPTAARPVAQLIHEKTGGNPFFAIQFLLALAEEGLLAFEPRAGMWTWDLSGIRAKRYSGDVVELVAEKLKRLPQTTQQVLKQLACLGNSAKISTLNLVYQESEE